MDEKNVKERLNPKGAETVRREAREAGREAGERVIEGLVKRGFADADVRPHVADGVGEAYRDIREKRK